MTPRLGPCIMTDRSEPIWMIRSAHNIRTLFIRFRIMKKAESAQVSTQPSRLAVSLHSALYSWLEGLERRDTPSTSLMSRKVFSPRILRMSLSL